MKALSKQKLRSVLYGGCVLLCAGTFGAMTLLVPGGKIDITREYDYSSMEEANENIPLEITDEETGQTYVLSSDMETEYEESKKTVYYEETQTLENLSEQTVPDSIEVVVNDKVYTLPLADVTYEETGDMQTLTESATYQSDTTATPNVPQTMEIAYTDANGDAQTATGTLKTVNRTSSDGYWTNVTQQGRVTLPADSVVYLYNGKAIVYDEASPAYAGYEEDVVAALGLNKETSRVKGAAWAGAGRSRADGTFVRYINYTIEQFVYDWIANYEATVDTHGYTATAVYRDLVSNLGMSEEDANASGKVITAIAHYTLQSVAQSNPLVKTVARHKVIASVASLLATVSVLLFGKVLFSKKKEAEYQDEFDVEDDVDDSEIPYGFADMSDEILGDEIPEEAPVEDPITKTPVETEVQKPAPKKTRKKSTKITK